MSELEIVYSIFDNYIVLYDQIPTLGRMMIAINPNISLRIKLTRYVYVIDILWLHENMCDIHPSKTRAYITPIQELS